METMNKLEKLHFEVIKKTENNRDYTVPLLVSFGQECSKVTEQIAVEFANFYVSYCNKHGQTHSEEVFQEFLKTKQ